MSWPRRSSLPPAAFEHPDDVLWEPCNNDLPPTEPQPGDFDVTSRAEDDAYRAEVHEALMGGWCASHPDRPADGRIVASYSPAPPTANPQAVATLCAALRDARAALQHVEAEGCCCPGKDHDPHCHIVATAAALARLDVVVDFGEEAE